MRPFRTTDLYFAAHLKAAGVQYVQCGRVDGRPTYWFESDFPIRDLKAGYYSRTAQVDALTYADALKFLKAAAYSV